MPDKEAGFVEPLTVVHKNDADILKAKDVVPAGVLVVDEKTYCKIARVGGWFDPDAEPALHRPALYLAGIKSTKPEEYANALRVLNPDWQPGETVTDDARAEGAAKTKGGKA